jgi:hypothetical protein
VVKLKVCAPGSFLYGVEERSGHAKSPKRYLRKILGLKGIDVLNLRANKEVGIRTTLGNEKYKTSYNGTARELRG